MTFNRPKTRWGAFGAHLLASLAIFFALAALMYFVWFPNGLFHFAGGWEGIRIIAGVDLVLGPALTLIIYKASKPIKELTLDLSFVALIQAGALSGGIYIIHQEKPEAVIIAYDTIYILQAAELPSDFNSLTESNLTPPSYFVELPPHQDDIDNMLQSHAIMGEPLYSRTDLYTPITKNNFELATLNLSSYQHCAHKARIITAFTTTVTCLKLSQEALKFEKLHPINLKP